MAGHAKYAPSAANRWMVCSGSVRLCAAVPDRTSVWAEEGTRAHYLLEQCLKRQLRSAKDGWAYHCRFFDPLDKTMCDAVQDVLDYVYDLLDAFPDAKLYTEDYVDLKSQEAPGEVGGTCDIAVYVPTLSLLVVIDFKYGAGVPVDIENNDQLKMYATGEILQSRFDVNGWSVRTVIIQPRAFHAQGPIREATYPVDYFLKQYWGYVEERVAATKPDNAPLVPGEKQCRWCPAAFKCPAREAHALNVIGPHFVSVKALPTNPLPEVKDVDADRLSFLLGAKQMVLDWFEEIDAEAKRRAMDGTPIPGYKLVYGQNRRRFAYEDEEIANVFMRLTGAPLDDVMPRKLLGMGELEKLIKRVYKSKRIAGSVRASATKAVTDFAFLTTKEPSGNLLLVPETDGRPAADRRHHFDNVQLPGVPTT